MEQLKTAIILYLVGFLVCGALSVEWSYTGNNGPSRWPELFPLCGGQGQSPIDLDPGTVQSKPDLTPLTFTGYDVDSRPADYQLTNDGHSVGLDILPNAGQMSVSHGGLPASYNLAALHFHWGNASSGGSEHTVNGKRYAAELHIVHYNEKYGASINASNYPDGLAVLGVFIDVGSKDHPVIAKLIQDFAKLKYADTKVSVSATFKMADILPQNVKNYYRYQGSLTTPECQEVVTWTVYKEPLKVSKEQMDAFRSLLVNKAGETPNKILENNYRPTQPLNGRPVYKSF